MKKIAVFIDNYNIDYSPSIIYLLDFLSESCRIDLFFQNIPMKNNPVLGKQNIHLIQIRPLFHWRGAWASVQQRLANGMKGHFRDAFLPSHSLRTVLRRFSSPGYHCHIVFDPCGMALCKKLFPAAKPFFYSLELSLLSEADSGGEYSTRRSLLEKVRSWSGDIRGLIIQSPEREGLFRSNYLVGRNIPALHLPVTYQGPALPERDDRLRQKYGIPPHARIAIHLGGVNPYFSSLEIAEIIAEVPGWYLFFQGNNPRGYAREIRRMAKRKGRRNVIISKRFHASLDKMFAYVQSADVGIAWYNDVNANFRTAGFSSGKIPAYMRCGLPVLANNLPSISESVARSGCGVCVDQLRQIPGALQKIEGDYGNYRRAALREYEKHYRFENYHAAIRDFFNI